MSSSTWSSENWYSPVQRETDAPDVGAVLAQEGRRGGAEPVARVVGEALQVVGRAARRAVGPATEVGWGVKRSAMGQGYAAEGAAAAIDWAFDNLGWEIVIHCIDKANAPSIALALRLGSTLQQENLRLAPPSDTHMVDIYGQTREQWRLRSQR